MHLTTVLPNKSWLVHFRALLLQVIQMLKYLAFEMRSGDYAFVYNLIQIMPPIFGGSASTLMDHPT